MKTYTINIKAFVKTNDINDEGNLELELMTLLEQFDEHFNDTKLTIKEITAIEK